MNHSRTPNNDLISRSALIKMLRFKRRAVYGSGSMDDIARVIEDVERFPAAKVVKAKPVRRGCWESDGNYLKCSECDRDFTMYDWEGSVNAYYWCPNCGAKMHVERKDYER